MIYFILATLIVCVTTLVVVSLRRRRVKRPSPDIFDICAEPDIHMIACPLCARNYNVDCKDCGGLGFVPADKDALAWSCAACDTGHSEDVQPLLLYVDHQVGHIKVCPGKCVFHRNRK